MTKKVTSTVLIVWTLGSLLAGFAQADEPIRNWWQDSGRAPGWGKPCQVRSNTEDGTSTKVVKCPKGMETPWVGDWKDEFWDGPCKVRLKATHDVFTSEVKCQSH